MRTVRRNILMELVVPEKYSISIKMNGAESEIDYTEIYSDDTPLETIDNTLVMLKPVFDGRGLTLTRIDDRTLNLHAIVSENDISDIMVAEFSNIRPDHFQLFPPNIVADS